MPDKPKSHRCAHCDVNWPFLPAYSKKCPLCKCETYQAADETPLTASDSSTMLLEHARKVKMRMEFEEFYADRELRKLQADIADYERQALLS